MAKKSCELCSNPARMFCESDQASLCWDCDEKVHAANFLVAKHSRTLLCHVCHSQTAWKASGQRIGPTVSVCHGCAGRVTPAPDLAERVEGVCENSQESESDDGEYYSEGDSEDYDDEDEEEEEEEEEDGENQVVPWTEEFTSTAASSSTSGGYLKRNRDYHFESEEEDDCCSSQNRDSKMLRSTHQIESDHENNVCSTSSFSRPLKMLRRTSDQDNIEIVKSSTLSGTAAIVEKLRKLQQQIVSADEGASAEMILGICKLSRDS